MSAVVASSHPHQPGDRVVFRWACLLVAVVALAAFGWMLNDMRLEVKALGQKAEKLADKTDALVDRVDKQVPQILDRADRASGQLDRQLPRILTQTEQASKALNTQLPTLLKRTETLLEHTEVAVDSMAELSDSFKQYKGLMGVVHVATQNKGLFSYATSLLGFLGKHDATVGLKKPGSDELRRAVPAKEWAAAAAKDAHFVSLGAKTKDDVLHGLARSGSSAPLHIKIGDKPPRLLAAWLKESHPESKATD
jgi:hypothetical protein